MMTYGSVTWCVVSLCLWLVLDAGPLLADDSVRRIYTLQDILTLAERHSPTLAGAEGLVKQSRGQQIAAGAYLNPSITGSAGRGAIRDPSTGVRVTERTLLVEQPIEWAGKRSARQEAADAGVAGAGAALDEAKVSLSADVKVAFYQLLYQQRDAELARQHVAAVEEMQRTVQARVAAGEATSFDRLKAGVELQKAQKDLARAQHALLAAGARLNALAAGTLGKGFSIQGEFRSLSQALDPDPLTALAIEQHPAIRRLAKLAEQADHSLRFEREARVPNITLLGSYHREAGDESLVAGISVPLPLWYRRQGEIQTALGAKHRADAERLRVRHELEAAITQHVQEVLTAHEQLQVFDNGLLKQAEQTVALAKMSFRHGAATLLDLLDAQRVYRQTLLEYAQAQSELSIALTRLERSLGAPL
ncbi:MAG: TolC family protein [Nitrospira sp.]|nr:MAG: putative cation efflux system protein CzcC [Nitrospira sp. OLB3]MCK6492480.1 TolC family protein [Nitrospira sp.]MCK6499070.1 TolC family protein [Nitrospira sp.]MEB2339617.1 TolC family protein [Nitrospirales bacterium]QOJ34023.1 MAG: TolC family protein [Nitrospira sp.]